MSGPDRIAAAFAGCAGRAALMPYLMGGFPDRDTALAIGEAYVRAGADLVEVGIPFSDPLADGPVIQEAGSRALAAGATPEAVLGTVAELSSKAPIVVLAYCNLVIARGAAAFAQELSAAGAAGLIVPDLPPEEAGEVAQACRDNGVALVPLAAPTSTDERLDEIARRAEGFVYAVSVTGTTGERSGEAGYGPLLERVRSHVDLPVALGFGISTPEQAEAAADAGADGVIVGSRLVREASESEDPPAACGEIVARFAQALR